MGRKCSITVSIDEKFNFWTVISDKIERGKNGQAIVLCQCKCGNKKKVNYYNLKRNESKGCKSCRRKTHGKSHYRLYSTWKKINRRCNDKTHEKYNYYGGRGIFVCEEWCEDFEIFFNWAVNNGYQDGLTIDRKNNDLGYFPTNCRWVTTQQNNFNRRGSQNPNKTSKYKDVSKIPSNKKIHGGLVLIIMVKINI